MIFIDITTIEDLLNTISKIIDNNFVKKNIIHKFTEDLIAAALIATSPFCKKCLILIR